MVCVRLRRWAPVVLLSPLVFCGSLAAAPTDEIQSALNRAPRSDEKPFAPAEGSVARVNPPAFVWLPVADKLLGRSASKPADDAGKPPRYVLALSRAADFAAGPGTTQIDAPISVHIPTRALEPGKWFWRPGARTAGGEIVWGRPRNFEIAADAKVWPLPDIKRLVAAVPKRHPRLFFPGDGLQKTRTEWPKAEDGEYRYVLRGADAALGKPLYAEPPMLSGKGPERGRLYAEIIRSSRPPMDAMERCALAYVISGQQRYGEEAKRLLLHFFAWNPEGSTSLFHNDEPAMWMMQRGTRAYDWTYDLFTPEERARIEPAMKARALQFLKRISGKPFESRPYESHVARDVGFLGETALCFIHEWPEAAGWLEYVCKIYWSVYPAWAQEDGGWQEGPSYWSAYQNFALHFATALKLATGAELIEKPFFRNTPYYKLYTNPPYARLSPFGDNQHSPPGGGAGQLLYAFSSLTRDPYLRWYPAQQGSGAGSQPMGVALYDASLTPRPPADLPQAHSFPGAGLVAMHDDLCDPRRSAYLVLRSSPFGSVSHGHADQNAFAIEAFGEALAIASGYYPWYGSWHHDGWTRQTKAVNSITFDGGQGQVGRSFDARGQISRFHTGTRFDYAVGDASAAYGGKLSRFVRQVVHIRPATFVIVDDVAAPQPLAWEWNLHALDKMELRPDKQEALLRRGEARLLASFATPVGLTLNQTDQFTPPPENNSPNQWHLVAAVKEKSTQARFVVVLRAYREAKGGKPVALAPLQMSDGGRTVRWKQDAGEFRLELNGEKIVVQAPAEKALNLPESRLAVGEDGLFRETLERSIVKSGPLTVEVAGKSHDVAVTQGPTGRLMWADRFAGPKGTYRVKLPPGMQLLVDVQPVRDGDAIALTEGQRLWWYGRPTELKAVLSKK